MRPSNSNLCNFTRKTNSLCKNYAYKGYLLCHIHDKRYRIWKSICNFFVIGVIGLLFYNFLISSSSLNSNTINAKLFC